MSISISLISSLGKSKKLLLPLMATTLLLVALTLVQDYLRSRLMQTGYYLSESLLFSSFWWFFAPFWYAQYRVIQWLSAKQHALKKTSVWHWVSYAVVPVFLHLLLYPALVWAISASAFNHTFSFKGTFTYTLSEYLYLLLALYSLPVIYAGFWGNKRAISPHIIETEKATETDTKPVIYTETLWVDAGNGTKTALPVSGIAYFTASTPYINLYAGGKKYLLATSLKALETQLNPEYFIRIHKTTLINKHFVTKVKSRQNGDYDIILRDGETLRVSRHYGANFKLQMQYSSLGSA